MSAALAIFVKTPGHSPIKTRLAASIGMGDALEFYRLAARAVMQVASATSDVKCNLQPYWAVAEREALHDPAWRDAPTLWQGEGGLGERLHHTYASLQARHGRVLLLGADAPQLTPELLRAALDALDVPHTPFVLGAASDGGFWLFGGRLPVASDIWCNIAYSRADTCAQLRAALAPCGIAELPTLTDVDSAADLPVVSEALEMQTNPLSAKLELRKWLSRRGISAALPGARSALKE